MMDRRDFFTMCAAGFATLLMGAKPQHGMPFARLKGAGLIKSKPISMNYANPKYTTLDVKLKSNDTIRGYPSSRMTQWDQYAKVWVKSHEQN